MLARVVRVPWAGAFCVPPPQRRWARYAAIEIMHEPWIERLIREALERGEFDHLPGAGRPIEDLDRPYEPGWWARRFVGQERRRAELDDLLETMNRELPRILAGDEEGPMRHALERYNEALAAWNEAASSDEDRIPLLDVDRLLERRSHRWRGRPS